MPDWFRVFLYVKISDSIHSILTPEWSTYFPQEYSPSHKKISVTQLLKALTQAFSVSFFETSLADVKPAWCASKQGIWFHQIFGSSVCLSGPQTLGKPIDYQAEIKHQSNQCFLVPLLLHRLRSIWLTLKSFCKYPFLFIPIYISICSRSVIVQN